MSSWLPRMSFRRRLVLSLFATLAIVLGSVGVALDGLIRHEALEVLDHRLKDEALVLARLLRFDGERVELPVEEGTLHGYDLPRDGAYFQIVAPGDAIVERSRSLGDALLPREDAAAALAELAETGKRSRRLRVVQGPHDAPLRLCTVAVRCKAAATGDDEAGTPASTAIAVQTARSLVPLHAEQAEIRWAMWIALPLALVLGTAAAWTVSRRSARPIERMSRDVLGIGPDHPEARVRLEGVDPELAGLGASLNTALDRLSESIRRERRFSADVAHELRTPLAIARSRLELALSRNRSPQQYRDAIAESLESCERLSRLVNALLLLARCEGGRLDLRPVDLGEIVRQAVSTADASAPHAAEAAARPQIDAGTWLVSGQPELLHRLVESLLENALRHGGPPDGVELRLSRSAQATAQIEVLDRGPGLAPELESRLFQRFSRGEPSRNPALGGLGLGLAIAHAIVRAHGGSIAAVNRPTGGLQVRVRLPLLPADAPTTRSGLMALTSPAS